MASFWEKLKSWFIEPDGAIKPAEPSRPQAAAARAQAPPAPPARVVPAKVVPAAPPPPKPAKDPFQSDILGLDEKALRERGIRLGQARWMGLSARRDLIPPISDERTAVADRSLILRGLATEDELREMHRVGDLWSLHHKTIDVINANAKRDAEAAIQALKLERAERKAKKKKEAEERRAAYVAGVAKRKAEDIIFLGRGVSGGLHDRRSDVEKLQRLGLPLLATPADVARALELPIGKLRWLCFHNEAAGRTHYITFQIPKRSGGLRTLSAPHETLSVAQEWVLRNILDKLPVEAPAHGFVKGRSTVTNAVPHLQRALVVNLDLSDFFPTIVFVRVRGVFQSMGYSPAVATVLALLCTEAPRRLVHYQGNAYHVACGPRALPQGASTSPAISNQIAKKLDRRLLGMSKKHGWTYTRYADDLTFSAGTAAGLPAEINTPMLLARVRHVVQDEGFALNPDKGRLQRRAGRQSVTGVVVNDKPAVPREELRQLRAILHQAQKTGLAAQNREGRAGYEAWLMGKIAYVMMVDRAKGEALRAQFDRAPK